MYTVRLDGVAALQLVHQRLLRWVHMGCRDQARWLVGLRHIDSTPIGERRYDDARDLRERGRVIERGCEHTTCLSQERQLPLCPLGLAQGIVACHEQLILGPVGLEELARS